jgi:glutamine synthetase
MHALAEYIWIDGTHPTAHVRSKTRVIPLEPGSDLAEGRPTVDSFPEWQFDGSSTGQAAGGDSDRYLRAVCVVPDPVRGKGNWLVLCEVFDPTEAPSATNTRAKLRAAMASGGGDHDCWVAFEQEYTFFKGSRPLGFPDERRFPAAQGPYYCGVGSDEVYGRPVVEAHLAACLAAGLAICGINAEVMPGQWEFQCGGPGVDPLTAADHLWLARWLLYRVGEDFGISATLDPKPVPGDWNGAGMHTNFSTAAMRAPGGMAAITHMCDKLGLRHDEHLRRYGHGNEARLTGHHETCSYREFRYGVADRTSSIRIPRLVAKVGYGYLEDRRPAANADPYLVNEALLRTLCDLW